MIDKISFLLSISVGGVVVEGSGAGLVDAVTTVAANVDGVNTGELLLAGKVIGSNLGQTLHHN